MSVEANPELARKVRENELNRQLKQQSSLRNAIGAYDQAQGEGSVQAIQQAIDRPQDPGYVESAKNSMSNMVNRLKGVIPRLNIVSADVADNVFGKELAKSIYSLEGRDINQARNEAYGELDALARQVKPTLGLVGAIEDRDWKALAAGTVNAITSLGSTAVPAIATAGAGLFTEMTGDAIVDFNETKAKKLGKSVEQLYKDDQAEFAVPAAIGTLSGALELYGIKGVKNLITDQIKGSGYKKALMMFAETQKEGLTEFVQTGLEEANRSLADGYSAEESAKRAVDKMFSEQGLESYLQGVVGSVGAGGMGQVAKYISNPEIKNQVAEETTRAEALQQDLNNPEVTPEAKVVIQQELDNSVKNVASLVEEDVKTEEKLTPKQRGKLNDVNEQIDVLQATVNDPNVSDATKESLQVKLDELNTQAKDIITSKEAPQETISAEPGNVSTQAKEAIVEPKITTNEEQAPTQEVVTENVSEKRTKEVLDKATTDLEALKQVSNKPAKYKASVKRLNDAFKAGEISEQEFNDTKSRFDDVIADSSPNVPKKGSLTQEEITSLDNELANQDLTTDDFIQYERARAIEDANNATEAVQQPSNDGGTTTGEIKTSQTTQEKIGGQNAIESRKIEQSNLTEREGTNGQQQGKQENREYKETTDKGGESKTSGSNIISESRSEQKIKEITDRRQSIKDRISQKLKDQRSNLSSGIDPSLLSDFIELGSTYIEEGIVKASDFIKRFREDYKEMGFDDSTISDEDIVNEVMPKQQKGSDKFKKLTHKNIQSEEVSSTLNNVERETGRELTKEEKEYRVTKRNDALNHGYDVVEQAKEEFGDTYVGDLLNYLNDNASTMSLENRALINISLELDLERQLQEDPDNLTLKKQLKLVRDASTKFQRSAAIATGYGILRQIARVGYDISQVTDQFFSEQQLDDRKKIIAAIESNVDEINKESERRANKKTSPKSKKRPSVKMRRARLELEKAKASFSEYLKKNRGTLNSLGDVATFVAEASKLIKAYGKLGIVSLEEVINEFKTDYGEDFVNDNINELEEAYRKVNPVKEKKVKTPEEIEANKLSNAKKQVEKRIAELNQEIAEKQRLRKKGSIEADQELMDLRAIRDELTKQRDKIIPIDKKPISEEAKIESQITRLNREIAELNEQIENKKKNEKPNKTSISNSEIDRLRAERTAKVELLNELDPEQYEVVEDALIDAGYGREITVATKDENGNKVKENRQILDWKKLAGEEGSLDNLTNVLNEVLLKIGYTKDEVNNAIEALKDQYNDLHASIIEKSLNELQNRNKERDPIDTKTSAKRLAELYNYGLFEQESDTYDNIVNRALGLSEVGQKAFNDAKVLAQALSDLYRTDINGRRVSELGLKEAIRNINTKIEDLLSSVAWEQSNKAFKFATVVKEYMGLSQRAMLQTVKQILENPLSGYIQRGFTKLGYSLDGTDTKALSKKRTEAARIIYNDIDTYGGLNYGEIITPFVSKGMFEKKLDGLSENRVYHTALSILLGRAYLDAADSMHKSALTERYFVHNLVRILVKKGMGKQEAVEYVSNNLTGQKFTDALGSAKQIIDKANEVAGKKILPDNPNAIYRLAQNIVKDALVVGENITLKEVEASYESAYKAAGFDLGHEANNIISETVSNATSKLENKIKQAIKDKKWNYATALTFTSILTKNVVNPFVSGGTNWLVLSLQKAGVDVVSPIVDYARQKENKLDLTTKDGVKNMENALLSEMRYKNTMNRVVIGAMASLLVAGVAIGSGEDEDLAKWLKKNSWAKKYFNVISPQALIFLISQENGELGQYLSGLFGVKYEGMGDASKLKDAFNGITSERKKENKKGYKKLGEVLGGHTSFPGPWRVARDLQNIYRGKQGEQPLAPDYKKGGFWDGYYRNGLVEYYWLNQED